LSLHKNTGKQGTLTGFENTTRFTKLKSIRDHNPNYATIIRDCNSCFPLGTAETRW